jgi:outer membrane protein OmpA-like peptidoglycan-associated protein
MTMTKDRRRFNPLVGLLVAIVGLIVLLVAQHIPNRHGMEADLTQRSEQALSSAGLSQVRVSFTGRDGTLRAGSPGEAERALGVVRALEGVRAAEAKVTPVPERTAPPSVVLALAGGRVSISGRVPTEAAQTALVAAAVAVFGTGAVDHRLTVDNSVTAAALSGLPEVLRALGRNAGDTTAELSDGRLVLTGALASAAGRAAVLAAAAGTGAAVVDQTRVADVQPQLTSLPSLTFPVGGVALTPGARASLVAAARILTANPDARIRIEGHTDSSGSAESNLAFSRTRARTVRDFLATQGVAAERMSTKGYGESQPKLSNTSAANRSVNRRVELVVSDGTPHQPGGGNGT